jgi:hypothetical protein
MVLRTEAIAAATIAASRRVALGRRANGAEPQSMPVSRRAGVLLPDPGWSEKRRRIGVAGSGEATCVPFE